MNQEQQAMSWIATKPVSTKWKNNLRPKKQINLSKPAANDFETWVLGRRNAHEKAKKPSNSTTIFIPGVIKNNKDAQTSSENDNKKIDLDSGMTLMKKSINYLLPQLRAVTKFLLKRMMKIQLSLMTPLRSRLLIILKEMTLKI